MEGINEIYLVTGLAESPGHVVAMQVCRLTQNQKSFHSFCLTIMVKGCACCLLNDLSGAPRGWNSGSTYRQDGAIRI